MVNNASRLKLTDVGNVAIRREYCRPLCPRVDVPRGVDAGRRPAGTVLGLARPLAGPGSAARGRDSFGQHLGSAWPRYDIHSESPGIPDPPHWGFRDVCITSRGKWTLM